MADNRALEFRLEFLNEKIKIQFAQRINSGSFLSFWVIYFQKWGDYEKILGVKLSIGKTIQKYLIVYCNLR